MFKEERYYNETDKKDGILSARLLTGGFLVEQLQQTG